MFSKYTHNMNMASPTKEFSVKKRTLNRENEVIKIIKELEFIPNTYGDRFIPRRYPNLAKYSRFKDINKIDNMNMNILEIRKRPDYWRAHNFKLRLDEVLGIDRNSRVLCLTDQTNRQIVKRNCNCVPKLLQIEPKYKNKFQLDWNCKPRIKPAAFLESVHDLPRFKKSFHDVIDWSAKGIIAATFDSKILLWKPKTDKTVAYNAFNVRAIKYNSTGSKLATVTIRNETNHIEIWDLENNDSRTNVNVSLKRDQISCLAWDNDDTAIVFGTMNGNLFIMKYPLLSVTSVHRPINLAETVIKVKFSPNGKYLVSSDLYGQALFWLWDREKCVLKQDSAWYGSSCEIHFDFHPWADGEVIIAEAHPARLHLIHIPSREIMSYYRVKRTDCTITQISFNKITAELVVAFSYDDDEENPYELLVLASMDRVVDILRVHEESITHMIWSPDGQLLGTVDLEESFSMWNYFGNTQETSSNLSNKIKSTKCDVVDRKSLLYQVIR